MVAVNLKSWDIVQARHVDTRSCINRFYVIVWPIIDYNDSLWSLFSSENYYSCNTMTYKVINHFLGQQRTIRLPHVMVLAAMTRWYEFFFWEGRVVNIDVCSYTCAQRTHLLYITLYLKFAMLWQVLYIFNLGWLINFCFEDWYCEIECHQ